MNQVKVIAEIASAHEGRIETMYSMIDVAKDSKCEYVKFQIFRAKQLVAKDHPKYENYLIKEFSEETWIEIGEYCKNIEISIIAEIFDLDSLLIAKKMNVSGYKIHSTSIFDLALLNGIAEEGKTIYLSTGGSTKEEIRKAIETLNDKKENDIILMHGFQNFPTLLEDTHLNKIASLKKEFGLSIGIQDHIEGSDLMAMIVPLLAIAKGCTVIEKHFTLNRSLKESDYYSSLNPDELSKFVQLVKNTTHAFGSDSFAMTEKELAYRNLLKKSIYTSREIAKGEEFSLNNLTFKRSLEEDRILTDKLEFILQKKANTNIPADARLTLKLIE